MALPIAGALFTGFISAIGFSIAEFAKRAAVAIGFGLITYNGAFYLFGQFEELLRNKMNGLPFDVLQIVGIMQIDVASTIILSAMASKLLLQGWNKLTDSRTGHGFGKQGGSDPTK